MHQYYLIRTLIRKIDEFVLDGASCRNVESLKIPIMYSKVSISLLNSTAPVLNIAHRGARAFAPENTLAAFAKARQFGCQMFELDVRFSKDGVLMVHHDANLLRCTDVAAKFPSRCNDPIDTFAYEELRCLDAGSWYVEQLALPAVRRQLFLQTLTTAEQAQFVSSEDERYYASGAVKLPTLQQALELVKNLDMLVNIELKMSHEEYPEAAQTVVNLIESLGMQARVLISSFEHVLLQQVRHLAPGMAIAVLTEQPITNVAAYLKRLAANAYHPPCYTRCSLTADSILNLVDIQFVIAAGWPVNVWTCNNKLDMRELLAAGVTGLVSDFPNRVQEVLGSQVMLP